MTRNQSTIGMGEAAQDVPPDLAAVMKSNSAALESMRSASPARYFEAATAIVDLLPGKYLTLGEAESVLDIAKALVRARSSRAEAEQVKDFLAGSR
jgi:hypothetical protein